MVCGVSLGEGHRATVSIGSVLSFSASVGTSGDHRTVTHIEQQNVVHGWFRMSWHLRCVSSMTVSHGDLWNFFEKQQLIAFRWQFATRKINTLSESSRRRRQTTVFRSLCEAKNTARQQSTEELSRVTDHSCCNPLGVGKLLRATDGE